MEEKLGLHGDYANGGWALVDGEGRPLTEYKYNYVTEWGGGYFKVEKGAKKNILRPDGSEVLDVWFNDVYRVDEDGFFVIGTTIRKTDTTPTQYLRGVAHVSGTILFPPIFKEVYRMKEIRSFYAEFKGKPLFISMTGGIYDPQKSHLPDEVVLDMKDYSEKFVNWVLPGLQFYYRDTDAPVDVDLVYHVGDVIRAGILMDVTTKLLKPAHRLRYIVASAHVASFFAVEDICKQNPDVAKWNLCTLHPNSFFKIMDIYRVENITQIFLLHIPESAAHYFGDNKMLFNFVNPDGSENNLVAMARASLDEKMRMEIHPRSLDPVFVDRMKLPVGLDEKYHPIPLPPQDFSFDPELKALCDVISRLAEDGDVEPNFEFHDRFPWKGIDGRVCEGCIYAQGIVGDGEGCGRLFKNSFRDRYIKGICEYRKTAIDEPSEYEEKLAQEQAAAKLKAEKMKNVFALNLVRDFIREHLGGDVNKLKDFQMFSLMDNEKYGNPYNCNDNKLLRSILSLVFADVWPEVSVDAVESFNFECCRINTTQNLLGSNIFDEYFKSLQLRAPRKGQHEAALSAYRKCETIGNFIIWPSKKSSFGQVLNGYDARGFMDQFLMRLYDVLTGKKKVNLDLKAAVYKNRNYMDAYKGEDGFRKFVRDMMLEDYVGEDLMPTQVFDFVWASKKGLMREDYLSAVDKNCALWEKLIAARTERIIEKLKQVLAENQPD